MLVFIPGQEIYYTGTLGSYQQNLPAIAAIELAKRLNDSHIARQCSIHPESKTVVKVFFDKGMRLEVAEFCCHDFKNKLEQLFDNEPLS